MNFQKLRNKMIHEQLEKRGITDFKVLHAMNSVAREKFVPIDIRNLSYQDSPLPIDCGQTISQPYIVALMLEFLNLQPTDRVLEIGTGSGYNTAIMSKLAKFIYSIEINKHLAEDAQKVLEDLEIFNVMIKNDDGFKGWSEKAPFDAIILTAAPQEVPKDLFDQLKIGGRLIAPVGESSQNLFLWTKREDKIEKELLMPVKFVPMIKQT